MLRMLTRSRHGHGPHHNTAAKTWLSVGPLSGQAAGPQKAPQPQLTLHSGGGEGFLGEAAELAFGQVEEGKGAKTCSSEDTRARGAASAGARPATEG